MQKNIFETEDIDLLKGLNDKQKEAVTHDGGPLLIIAGAGTGKTSVITRRIAYLIEKKLAKPSEILALTFTEKAAAEMEERVDLMIPYGTTDMLISTFHSFGDRLLRDHSLDIGLPANFKILSGIEQAIFMHQNIYKFDLNYYRPIASPLSHIDALLKHFSRLKDELISPEEYLKYAQGLDQIEENEHTLELAQAYDQYQKMMIEAGNMDFGDLIYLSCKMLRENKKVLADCHKRFKYILVDEFQDTNYAQNELVKLLSQGENNLTVVGDDDQSIYRFRGASISNIMQFKEEYPEITEIVLTQNYRSTQEILDASYRLIQNNNPDRLEIQNKIDKRLIAQKHGNLPELILCENLSAEADAVAKKILEIKDRNGYKFNDFAILVRANSSAEPFIQSLNIHGIPHIFSGSSSLISKPEIKMLFSFLKCLVYPDDSLAFYQLATSKIYNISHQELSDYYCTSKRTNRSLRFIIEHDTSEKSDGIVQLITDIAKYSSRKNDSCGEVLYDFLAEKNYLKMLSDDITTENEIEIQNIAKFFDRIATFNHVTPDKSVLAFLNNLEFVSQYGDEIVVSDIDPSLDAVNILTAHASKGMEYEVVFIVSCVSDRFPSRNYKDQLPIPDELIKERLPEGDYHAMEERRLFYVAATRAKTYLFLSSAEDYGGKRKKKLSPFAAELLDQEQLKTINKKRSPIESIEKFNKIEEPTAKLPDRFTGDILKLSRQQIDDYFSCPKKFYFAHIIKIPLLENQFLMYGTAIHAALDHFFNRRINNIKTSLEELLSDYKQAFRNVGFIAANQEDLRYQQGAETLTRFYQREEKTPTPASEVEFPFEFFENNIKINGRFDLISRAPEKSEIFDFKTSAVKDQKDADSRIKKSVQMMIYSLAWYEKYKTIPTTTLVFIESGLIGTATFSEAELENTKQMIFTVAAGIRENDMRAKPDAFQCNYCPYNTICGDAKN
ncbi:MAG: ATP-dependent DNA helicase [Candidatus Berkelbacteria bacterium]